MREKRKYSATEERTLLTALITHDRILEKIHLQTGTEKRLFRSRWSNLVAGWCFDHFAKYGTAPKQAVKNIFQDYSASAKDEETVELVESYLSGLSDEFERAEDINEAFVVDLASSHFRTIKLERTLEEIQAALERKDPASAEAAISSYESVAFGSFDWVDPTHAELIHSVLEEREDRSVVRFPGDMDRFLSPYFERDGFISFVGPEKRGKSYWLMDTVWRAWNQRRKTLYYVVGDMSQVQVMRRLLSRAALRPLRACKIERPIRIEKLDDNRAQVETETRKYPALSIKEAKQAMRRVLKTTGSSKSRLRIRCCGAGSISASDIERDIRLMARQGWVPDVVVVDYADVLDPEPNAKRWDYRHQVNETWKVMRRISQDHHLLMVTATQAAASSYDSWIVRKKDFSEDKRKNAHVTGMLGINQTQEEKVQGIYRLNWVFLREGYWSDSQVIWTAGNLGLACPCLVSTL